MSEVHLKPTEAEVKVIRAIRTKAADLVREDQTEIDVTPSEFRVLFLFEEMQMMAAAVGKPIHCFYYGLKVNHKKMLAH